MSSNSFSPGDSFEFIGYITNNGVKSDTKTADVIGNQIFTFNYSSSFAFVNINFSATFNSNSVMPDSIRIINNTEAWELLLIRENSLTLQYDLSGSKATTTNPFTPGDSFTFIGYYGWFDRDTISATINNNSSFAFGFINPAELIITGYTGGTVEWICIMPAIANTNKVGDAIDARGDIIQSGTTLYIQLYTVVDYDGNVNDNTSDAERYSLEIEQFRGSGKMIILYDSSAQMQYIKTYVLSTINFSSPPQTVTWGGWTPNPF
jgi:hypothetical protein